MISATTPLYTETALVLLLTLCPNFGRMGLMKKWLSILLALISIQIVAFASTSSFEEIKEEIAHYQNALKEPQSEIEKSELHYKLALAYFYDQEVEKAFQHFLLSLEGVESKTAPKMKEEEENLYKEALDFYLSRSGNDPISVAKQMLEHYGEIASQNQHIAELGLLMATAYANLGIYDLFFKRFVHAYPYLKDTFLAYKTQGILNLRLSHHSRLAKERHGYQERAFHYLTLALDRNPKDASLYKVLIFLAKDEKNDLLIRSYLQKMVEHRVPSSRGDIYLYVREAALLGEYEVGQKIIDQATVLYDYSRAITAAQEYLNQHRG